jgi:hypothetical protein
MLASVLSAVNALSRIPSALSALWQWARRNKLNVIVSTVQFTPESYCGAAIVVELLNRTDRTIDVSVFVTLHSGDVLVPRTGNMYPLNPQEIKSERNAEVYIPLTVPRSKPHTRPQIAVIKLQDQVKRTSVVSKRAIERLNDQILNEWPFSEDEEINL